MVPGKNMPSLPSDHLNYEFLKVSGGFCYLAILNYRS